MSNTPIIGLIPVLATPFQSDGTLDVPSLERVIEFQVASGADALAVFGMASEGFALGAQDRQDILTALQRCAPDLPVVAGVSLPASQPAVEELHRLKSAGAAGAMVMPPSMVKPAPNQVRDFFAEVGAAGLELGIDIMVQDAPGATGVVMAADVLKEICELPGISSIKIEAPPTIAKFEALAKTAKSNGIALLGGQNAQFMLDEYARGASGTMPACEFTDLLTPILAAQASGDDETARELFDAILPLIVWGLQPGMAWSIHKAILKHRGLISETTVRSPARDASERMQQEAVLTFKRCAKRVHAITGSQV